MKSLSLSEVFVKRWALISPFGCSALNEVMETQRKALGWKLPVLPALALPEFLNFPRENQREPPEGVGSKSIGIGGICAPPSLMWKLGLLWSCFSAALVYILVSSPY